VRIKEKANTICSKGREKLNSLDNRRAYAKQAQTIWTFYRGPFIWPRLRLHRDFTSYG